MFMLKASYAGEELFTLTLLAKNNEGYKTSLYCFQKPINAAMWTCLYIDQEWLIEHREV